MGINCDPLPIARYALSCITLHRLRAYYWFVMENPRCADPGIKELWDTLTFDRRVQSVLLKYIGIFESRFRSVYSRLMEEACGPFAVYEERNFLREDIYQKTRSNYEKDISRQMHDGLIRCEKAQNDGKLPLHIAVEFISLGSLSKLYSNTKSGDVVKACAREFNVNQDKMRSWIKTLAAVRNCCAHFNPYITRKQIPSTPLPLKGEESISRHPFYAAMMLEHLLFHDGAWRIGDQNLHFVKRLRMDMSMHVGQFLNLYNFSDQVADALWIPNRYRPERVESEDGGGTSIFAIDSVIIPDNRGEGPKQQS